jgi:hypothetical protein
MKSNQNSNRLIDTSVHVNVLASKVGVNLAIVRHRTSVTSQPTLISESLCDVDEHAM